MKEWRPRMPESLNLWAAFRAMVLRPAAARRGSALGSSVDRHRPRPTTTSREPRICKPDSGPALAAPSQPSNSRTTNDAPAPRRGNAPARREFDPNPAPGCVINPTASTWSCERSRGREAPRHPIPVCCYEYRELWMSTRGCAFLAASQMTHATAPEAADDRVPAHHLNL
jgi:hypothetical protein